MIENNSIGRQVRNCFINYEERGVGQIVAAVRHILPIGSELL